MQDKAAVVVLALLLAGCGSNPKTHLYILGTVSGRSQHDLSGAPAQFGSVTLPAALDRISLVTRGTADQVIVSEQDRWTAPLDELVRRAMTEDLRARLGSDRALAPGHPAPPDGVRGIMLNVQQFIADTTRQVVPDADWNVGFRRRHTLPRYEDSA
jgi:uncharacterized protein